MIYIYTYIYIYIYIYIYVYIYIGLGDGGQAPGEKVPELIEALMNVADRLTCAPRVVLSAGG